MQDLVPVGQRMHRKGSTKECIKVLKGAVICNEIESLQHRVLSCESVRVSSSVIAVVLRKLIEREVNERLILSLSFRHRRRSTLQVSLWFVVKALHFIYKSSRVKKDEMITEILTENKSNIENNILIGSRQEMIRLNMILQAMLN